MRHPHTRLRGLALDDAFKELLEQHDRIAIVGGPKVGKTSICKRCVHDRPVFGSDQLIGLPFPDLPHALIGATTGIRKFVVEGVMTARALRKGMRVDCIVLLTKPRQELKPGQAAMAKGIATIMRSFEPTAPIVQLT